MMVPNCKIWIVLGGVLSYICTNVVALLVVAGGRDRNKNY